MICEIYNLFELDDDDFYLFPQSNSQSYLFRKKALDWEKRFEFLVGKSELAYLHEAFEVKIIHKYIKASNILLDKRLKPKIADFGVVRYFSKGHSHLSTSLVGTL